MYMAFSDHAVSSVLIRQHEGPKAHTLPQQNPSRCGNVVLASTENGVSPGSCYKKATALFPSLYHVGAY